MKDRNERKAFTIFRTIGLDLNGNIELLQNENDFNPMFYYMHFSFLL